MIEQIWKDLEDDPSSTGFLFRRYSSAVLTDVYVALRKPGNIRCIAVGMNKDVNINIAGYTGLKDIRFDLVENEQKHPGKFLFIQLVSQLHKDIFAILCEDLMNRIGNISDEKKVIRILLNRIEQWESLFEKAGMQGLDSSAQRGLYGELFFLRKWIQEVNEGVKPVQAWLGPEAALRDFQTGNWGVEVKTTQGNKHQKIQVNGERQLDASMLDNLFLLHLSLEVQPQHGETLNQIVDELTELVAHDYATQRAFRTKLFQIGYFDHHKFLYDNMGYQIREETYYAVRENFPRIEEKELRSGVGEVMYTIILSEQSEYIIPLSVVFQTIN